MESYIERIFHAVEELIRKRDPELGEDEINRQALDLIEENVRPEAALSTLPQGPAPKPNELEDLQKQARGLADALENLSFQSKIVLSFFSDRMSLSNQTRVQRDAKNLGEILRKGLEEEPPPRRGRRKDFAKEDLIKEATDVFEQAYGVGLKDLPELPMPKRRKTKQEYYSFVRTYLSIQNIYELDSKFETLKKYAKRYLESLIKN